MWPGRGSASTVSLQPQTRSSSTREPSRSSSCSTTALETSLPTSHRPRRVCSMATPPQSRDSILVQDGQQSPIWSECLPSRFSWLDLARNGILSRALTLPRDSPWRTGYRHEHCGAIVRNEGDSTQDRFSTIAWPPTVSYGELSERRVDHVARHEVRIMSIESMVGLSLAVAFLVGLTIYGTGGKANTASGKRSGQQARQHERRHRPCRPRARTSRTLSNKHHSTLQTHTNQATIGTSSTRDPRLYATTRTIHASVPSADLEPQPAPSLDRLR